MVRARRISRFAGPEVLREKSALFGREGSCHGTLRRGAREETVGLAMRAERKVIDKIVDGLKFHS